MTEHKHLKKLIRDRMAGTGESYTTARRHVVTAAARRQAPVPPPGLVPGYDAFGGGQHRLSALAANLLRQAGHTAPHTGEPYTEAMVAGLAGGIGFMYAVFEYKGWPPLMTIVAQHHPEPWLPAILDRLGAGYTQEHSTTAKPALAALHRALDAGRPVYCTIDMTALPWHAGELAHSEVPHEVVVAGRHDGLLHLDDSAVAPVSIPERDFAAAWSRHRKGRHHRVVLSPAAGTTPDLPAAVRDAVRTTVAHLTGPVLGHSFDSNFGFSGMAKLAAQLRDTRTKNGWPRRFGAPVPFFHGVRRLYECLELQFTAPGATRPLYADFLDEAAPVAGAPVLAEAAALVRESGALWSRVAGLAGEATAGLGEYTELCEQRLLLMLTGRECTDELRALSAKIDELTASYSDPLGEQGRAALFGRLADLVDEAREREERAVALLSAV